MAIKDRKIRVAIYGCGRFANRVHIPNLLKLDNVEIIAICDINPQALKATAEAFNIHNTYQDGHQMLDNAEIDVLYSVVPAYARTDIEATAAARGIHIFSEKPQALTMSVANQIDDAIRKTGAISTVGFRERYRPIFQAARKHLEDKKIVHARFQRVGGLPGPIPKERKHSWWVQLEKSGGPALDWGVHAVDYTRFMTNLNIIQAQAFYCQRPSYHIPLSCSFNYCFANDATMTMAFISAAPGGLSDEPWFNIFYEGGRLALYRYDRIEVNGEVIYNGEEFDPWFEHDKTFIEAVRTGDSSYLLNDYHDGLFSLAPVLAGWESARRNGECIEVKSFMECK